MPDYFNTNLSFYKSKFSDIDVYHFNLFECVAHLNLWEGKGPKLRMLPSNMVCICFQWGAVPVHWHHVSLLVRTRCL